MSESDRAMDLAVSLVVPVKNESDTFEEFWASVDAQTLAPSEIVLVDAGSSDGTAELLARLPRTDPRVKIVHASGAYPGTARNAGIETARHQVLAMADCGTVLAPTWLEELARAYSSREHCEVVYGGYEPIGQTAVQRWNSLAFVPARRTQEGETWRGETVASMLIAKDAWARVGGFRPWRAAEDLDFLDRLRSQSGQTAIAPRAVAYWRPPGSLSRTFRRLALYSRHNVWAGQQRRWHYGVARIYGFSALIALVAWLAVGRRWPSRVTLTVYGASLFSRTFKHTRDTNPDLRGPDRLGVAIMILIGDAATFVGWATAYLRRRPSEYGSARTPSARPRQ
jgi:cellulose synthase/poly-beta-1,6-N-acetylglucosamine synthase-like glycosyltransferase